MAMKVLLPSPSTAHGDEGEASLLKAVALPPLRGESGAGELNTMRPELALVGSLRLGSGAGATTSMPPRRRPRQQLSGVRVLNNCHQGACTMSRSLWLLARPTNASAARRLLRALELFRAHFVECHHEIIRT